MKPSFPNWTNPYIDKIENIPDIVAPCYEGAPSEDEKAKLSERRSHFDDVYCEFGSGSGRHLVERAAADPKSFYVGFELRYKRACRTAEKAFARGIENLFVLRCNAHLVFDLFPLESLSGIYVNFPDPWDRRRWEKHRMLTEDFLGRLPQVLKSNGFLSYKTDHETRFHETSNLLGTMPAWTIEKLTENLHSEDLRDDYVKTEFESLFSSKGMRIFYVLARKAA